MQVGSMPSRTAGQVVRPPTGTERMATEKRPKSKLQVARERRGWTARDLCERMHLAAEERGWPIPQGLTTVYIAKWESRSLKTNQQPSHYYILLLCVVLRVSSDDLGLPGNVTPSKWPELATPQVPVGLVDSKPAAIDQGGDETKRRELLQYGAGMAVTAMLGGNPDWRLFTESGVMESSASEMARVVRQIQSGTTRIEDWVEDR